MIFEDGRVIITFNYRDEPVEATIDDIIAAANNSSDIGTQIGAAAPIWHRR